MGQGARARCRGILRSGKEIRAFAGAVEQLWLRRLDALELLHLEGDHHQFTASVRRTERKLPGVSYGAEIAKEVEEKGR